MEVIDSFEGLAAKYQTFLFDCDGVLYIRDQPIPGAFSALQYLQSHFPEKKIFFLTNNPRLSQEAFIDKMKTVFNYEVLLPQALTCCYLAPLYLKRKYPQIKNVLVTGPPGLKQEFKRSGFQVENNTFDPLKTSITLEQFDNLDIGETNPSTRIEAVIASTDCNFNFYRQAFASLCVQRGAKLIQTHTDYYAKSKYGFFPGGGIIAEMIAMAAGSTLETVGKPSTFAIELLQELGIKKEGMVMIGDNPNTDIKFAKQAGIDSVLVLSGATSLKEAEKCEIKSTYILPKLGTFKES